MQETEHLNKFQTSLNKSQQFRIILNYNLRQYVNYQFII